MTFDVKATLAKIDAMLIEARDIQRLNNIARDNLIEQRVILTRKVTLLNETLALYR